MKFTAIIVVIAIFWLLVVGGIVFGVVKCSSWLTSGEVGKDIGNFAGEVQKGFEEGKK